MQSREAGLNCYQNTCGIRAPYGALRPAVGPHIVPNGDSRNIFAMEGENSQLESILQGDLRGVVAVRLATGEESAAALKPKKYAMERALIELVSGDFLNGDPRRGGFGAVGSDE